MTIEQIAMQAAGLALDLIEAKLSDYQARKLASDRVAMIMREKLLLRSDAQEMLDARKAKR